MPSCPTGPNAAAGRKAENSSFQRVVAGVDPALVRRLALPFPGHVTLGQSIVLWAHFGLLWPVGRAVRKRRRSAYTKRPRHGSLASGQPLSVPHYQQRSPGVRPAPDFLPVALPWRAGLWPQISAGGLSHRSPLTPQGSSCG